MPTLSAITFQHFLVPKDREEGFVVCARGASDGTASLLLFEAGAADDLSEKIPHMFISDHTGDRLSIRVMDCALNARSVAETLVHELVDSIEELDNAALSAFIESLNAWVVENRSKRELACDASSSAGEARQARLTSSSSPAS